MGERVRVLIVDDDVSQCQTLSMILKYKGYDVDTAHDGPEGIRRVKERPYEVIFTDMKMPAMNGLETYRRIREIRPGAVVTMMTAYALDDLVQQGLEEGANGVLYKPLDIEVILTTIAEVEGIEKEKLDGAR